MYTIHVKKAKELLCAEITSNQISTIGGVVKQTSTTQPSANFVHENNGSANGGSHNELDLRTILDRRTYVRKTYDAAGIDNKSFEKEKEDVWWSKVRRSRRCVTVSVVITVCPVCRSHPLIKTAKPNTYRVHQNSPFIANWLVFYRECQEYLAVSDDHLSNALKKALPVRIFPELFLLNCDIRILYDSILVRILCFLYVCTRWRRTRRERINLF